MRLSRSKINHLSHLIVDLLAAEEKVEFLESNNEVRLGIVRVLNEELALEDRIDTQVREKIRSQQKSIPEGSAEWEILFKKYYEEEYQKHRKIR